MDIGTLTGSLEFEVDTSKIDEVNNLVQQFGQRVEEVSTTFLAFGKNVAGGVTDILGQAATAVTAFSQQSDHATTAVEGLSKATGQAEAAVTDLNKSTLQSEIATDGWLRTLSEFGKGVLIGAFTEVNEQLQAYKNRADDAAKATSDVKKTTDQAAEASTGWMHTLAEFGKGVFEGALTGIIEKLRAYKNRTDEAAAGTGGVKKATDEAAQATGGWGSKLVEWGHSMVAQIALGHLLRDAVLEVIKVGKEMVSWLVELAMRGSEVASVADNFKNLTDQAGRLGSELLGSLREGTHGMITNFELMKVVNKDLGAGMNLTGEQFKTMAEGAHALSQATGVDLNTAFNQFNQALLTGQPRMLKRLIGAIDLKGAEDNYAKSIGKVVEQLNEAEKTEGRRVGMLEAIAKETKRLGEQTEGLADKVRQIKTDWANFEDELGRVINQSPVVTAAINNISKAIRDAFGANQKQGIDVIVRGVEDLALAAVDAAIAVVDAIGKMRSAWIDIKGTVADFMLFKAHGDTLALSIGANMPWATQATKDQLVAAQKDLKYWEDAVANVAEKEGAGSNTRDKYTTSLTNLRTEMEKAGKIAEANRRAREQFGDDIFPFVKPLPTKGPFGGEGDDSGQTAYGKKVEKATTDSIARTERAWSEYFALIEKSAGEDLESKLTLIDVWEKRQVAALDAGKKYNVNYQNELTAITELAVQKRLDAEVQSSMATIALSESIGDAAQNAVAKGLGGQNVLFTMAQTMGTKTLGVISQIPPLNVLIGTSATEGEKWIAKATTDMAKDFLTLSDEQLNNIQRMHELGATGPEIAATLNVSLKSVELQTYSLGDALKSVLKGIPDLLVDAFTGGGNLLGAVKGLAVQLGAVFAEGLKNSIAKNLGPNGIGSAISGTTIKGAAGLGAAAGIGALAGGAGAKGAVGAVAMASVGAMTAAAGAYSAAAATAAASGAALNTSMIATVATVGAWTAGIGAAAIGAYLLIRHFTAVSAAEKAARAEFEKFSKAIDVSNVDEFIAKVGKAYADLGQGGETARKAIQSVLDATHKSPQALATALLPIAAMIDKAADLNDTLQKITATSQTIKHALPDAIKASIAALMNAAGATDAMKAALQGVLDNAKPNYEELTKQASDYGITLEGLGPKFQQAHIEDRAKSIMDFFNDAKAAGADVGGVLSGLSDEISELVDDSKKFGTAIPRNMKPLIDELAKSGKLLDDQGNKIEDTSDITFEDTPLDKSLKGLNDAIDHLAEVLDLVPGKLDKIGSAADNLPTNPMDGWDVPTGPRTGGGPDAEYHATGGTVGVNFPGSPRGTDTIPTWLTRGEQVSSVSEVHADAAAMMALQREVAGMRADMVTKMPRVMGRAVESALVGVRTAS